MPILSIIQQPTDNSLLAAYRPIVYVVKAVQPPPITTTNYIPPVVFCDIYFNNVYFKSLGKTQTSNVPDIVNFIDAEFTFDIQDACQEYLKSKLPVNGGDTTIDANTTYASIQCKFRASGYDANGFVLVEDTPPIQGTGNNAPVSGTGFDSTIAIVINSTLQHEDNQDLSTHLVYNRPEKLNGAIASWNANFLPLTHRPFVYSITKFNSDYYPFFCKADLDYYIKVVINKKDGTQQIEQSNTFHLDANKVYFLPTGTANIDNWLGSPLLDDWDLVNNYQVTLYENGTNNLLLFTNSFKVDCYNPNNVRLHFLNYLGTFDAINFNPPEVVHSPSSSEYQKSLKYPLQKTDTGIERFNVRSNELYETKCGFYGEKQMDWCMELFDSPKSYIEWNGTQGQNDNFLPIKIEDTKVKKRKEDDRYYYEIVLQFKLSNEKIIIRN